MIRSLFAALGLLALTTAVRAEPLQITFEVLKVSHASDGTEKLLPAEKAAPGEVVEYRAKFTNRSTSTLTDLKPEIPVPAGMTFVAHSDQPEAAEGSLDGTTFGRMPLIDAEGHQVSTDKIRVLRWPVAALKSAESRVFRLRAVVGK